VVRVRYFTLCCAGVLRDSVALGNGKPQRFLGQCDRLNPAPEWIPSETTALLHAIELKSMERSISDLRFLKV
jgi:hypothetical protein